MNYIKQLLKLPTPPSLKYIEPYVKLRTAYGHIPLELYPHQKNILSKLHHNYITVVKNSRQSGITTTIKIAAVMQAMQHPNRVIVIVTPSIRQSQHLLQDIVEMFDKVVKLKRIHDTITLENGSVIKLKSGMLTGTRFDCLIVDDAAYHKLNLCEMVVEAKFAMMESTNPKILITSTPNPYSNNGFDDIFIHADNTITVNWNDVPHRDYNFKERMIAILGEQQWKHEYEVTSLGS